MKQFLLPAAAFALVVGHAAAPAQPRSRDQDAAYRDMKRGQLRPLPEIEARIVPGMAGASYLGPEYDPESARYRLKFMRAGSVIWVDIDGRTGRVIGRSGN